MKVLGGLFDRSLDVMEKTLSLRLSRHSHIASNLANMDTPGYKVRDLPFEKALQNALPKESGQLAMVQTHPKHRPVDDMQKAYQSAQKNVVYGVYGQDQEGADILDIEMEMTKLVKNQLMYNATVQMLAKQFAKLKYAISEGGR